MSRLDETLDALAEPTRRRVVDLLARGSMRAGDLAEATGSSPPAMSRHLRTLRRLGLVDAETHPEDARVRVYSLRPEPLEEVRGWLETVEGYWADQLHAFRDHAERRSR